MSEDEPLYRLGPGASLDDDSLILWDAGDSVAMQATDSVEHVQVNIPRADVRALRDALTKWLGEKIIEVELQGADGTVIRRRENTYRKKGLDVTNRRATLQR